MYQGHQRHLEPFSRDILFISVYESCRHRKMAATEARHLTDTIISRLLRNKHSATVQRHHVIAAATEVLQSFDPAAGVQYTAYHPL